MVRKDKKRYKNFVNMAEALRYCSSKDVQLGLFLILLFSFIVRRQKKKKKNNRMHIKSISSGTVFEIGNNPNVQQ